MEPSRVFLASLSFLGVLAFHFPEYLTTPELRQSYDVSIIRTIMFVALIVAGTLGLLNVVRNKRKRLGMFSLVVVFTCIQMNIGNARNGFRQAGNFKIVCGKQCERLH